jgi:hypothetical protein
MPPGEEACPAPATRSRRLIRQRRPRPDERHERVASARVRPIGNNGGALSSIGVSWNILNTLLSENTAVGHGANDGQGGNGGAIYNDGNEIVLNITSSLLENNMANEGGSAVFFVSNNKSGSMAIADSIA